MLELAWEEKKGWGARGAEASQHTTQRWASSTGHGHVPEAHGHAGRQPGLPGLARELEGGLGTERAVRVAVSTLAEQEMQTQERFSG